MLTDSELNSQISGLQAASWGGPKWYFTEILICFSLEDLHSSIILNNYSPSHHCASSRLNQKLCDCLPNIDIVGQINFFYRNTTLDTKYFELKSTFLKSFAPKTQPNRIRQSSHLDSTDKANQYREKSFLLLAVSLKHFTAI